MLTTSQDCLTASLVCIVRCDVEIKVTEDSSDHSSSRFLSRGESEWGLEMLTLSCTDIQTLGTHSDTQWHTGHIVTHRVSWHQWSCGWHGVRVTQNENILNREYCCRVIVDNMNDISDIWATLCRNDDRTWNKPLRDSWSYLQIRRGKRWAPRWQTRTRGSRSPWGASRRWRMWPTSRRASTDTSTTPSSRTDT